MTKTNFIRSISKRADVDTESRTVRFVLSSETPDRVQDVIRVDGWELKNYKNNPVVLWGHDHDIPAIGRMSKIGVEGKALVGDVKFATQDQSPFADTIFRLVAGEIINTGSVGFMPLEWTFDETRGGFNFERCELLEYSIVNIPMHPDARRRAVKAGVEHEELDLLEKYTGRDLPDFRQTLIDQSAAQKLKSAHGRLAMRAAVSNAFLKVSDNESY